jgi:hypothetical protein
MDDTKPIIGPLEPQRLLRLFWQARRRLIRILHQSLADWRKAENPADVAGSILRFCRLAHKWSEALQWLDLYGRIHGNALVGWQMAQRLAEWSNNLKGQAHFWNALALINEHTALLHGDLIWALKAMPRKAPVYLTNLKGLQPDIVTLRNAYFITDHDYSQAEVPSFSCNCLKDDNGDVCYLDGESLMELGLDEMACIAGARLHRAYERLHVIAGDYVLTDFWRQQLQEQLDWNAQLLKAFYDKAMNDSRQERNEP